MEYRFARPLLATLCLTLHAAAGHAADLIPTEAFARRPPMTMPRLSPDGKHFSVVYHFPDGRSHAIAIYDVGDSNQPTALIRMGPYELPANVIWASNTRLVLARGKQFGSIGETSFLGELMAVDIDGKNSDYLYGYQTLGKRSPTRAPDQGWAYLAGTPEHSNGHFYMRTKSWIDGNLSTLYDVDATGGSRRQLAQIGIGGMTFMMNNDGSVRYAYGTDDDYTWAVFRKDGGGWTRVPTTGDRQGFMPIAPVAGNPARIYAYDSPNGNGGEFVEQDDDGGNRRVIRRDDFSEVSAAGLWASAPARPFATTALAGVPTITYIDPNEPIARLHSTISGKFPGSVVHFIDFSEDGGQLIFSVSSDRDPGRYVLIDTKTLKARVLFAKRPSLDPSLMAERRPMRFNASDGLQLEAILTFPKGKAETNLPMVLLPHGGPHGENDDWYFDQDAQFLANRGYLVLQVNYRGSSGRGDNFESAGYLKWGTRIQQDLIDGVKWAIDQKFADPGRICVYGASFGGYSAMMTTIRQPGMFKCAVGYAGIYDLDMMYNKGDIKQKQVGRSYLTSVIGRDAADLDANSPTHLADRIGVPVLLVHGEDDERAPYAQFKAMRAALDAAHKPYETLTRSGEKHGFVKPENIQAFYETLQAFLDRNIGEGAAPSATH